MIWRETIAGQWLGKRCKCIVDGRERHVIDVDYATDEYCVIYDQHLLLAWAPLYHTDSDEMVDTLVAITMIKAYLEWYGHIRKLSKLYSFLFIVSTYSISEMWIIHSMCIGVNTLFNKTYDNTIYPHPHAFDRPTLMQKTMYSMKDHTRRAASIDYSLGGMAPEFNHPIARRTMVHRIMAHRINPTGANELNSEIETLQARLNSLRAMHAQSGKTPLAKAPLAKAPSADPLLEAESSIFSNVNEILKEPP